MLILGICAGLFLVASSAAAVAQKRAIAGKKDVDVDALCKGYVARNVHRYPDGLTAELVLVGEGRNVYGKDVERLRLVVKYEESMFLPYFLPPPLPLQ